MKDERIRDYVLTELSTLENVNNNTAEVELLKHIYSEVNSNYRNLADIRFKLLGLVPAASIIAWAELINKIAPDSLHNAVSGLVVSLLGIRITYGIRIYDK